MSISARSAIGLYWKRMNGQQQDVVKSLGALVGISILAILVSPESSFDLHAGCLAMAQSPREVWKV